MAEPIYKVLDCQRKGVLRLPSGAVHLWLTYWMHESEDNESYISDRALAAVMNVDRGTVMKWRQYLLANGWLKLTGGSAADKYDNPTRGASQVLSMRVDDPLKGRLAEKAGREGGGGIAQPESGGNFTGGEIQPKVYGSDSVSNSRCVTVPSTATSVAIGTQEITFSLRSNDEGQNQEQNQGQNQKQKQKPQRVASPVEPQLKQSPKYDSPFPAEFNRWSVLARAEWVEAHAVINKPKPPVPAHEQEASVPSEGKAEPVTPPRVKPPSAAPPPAAKSPEVKSGFDETELKLKIAKNLALDICKLQMYYNAKVQLPAEWETVWAMEASKLVELVDAQSPYLPRWYMLHDVIVVSQVKYATKYTSPGVIAEHIPELADEVLTLVIRDELNAMWDLYWIGLGIKVNSDDELDVESLERKAREKQKDREARLKAWQQWTVKHGKQNQLESNVA